MFWMINPKAETVKKGFLTCRKAPTGYFPAASTKEENSLCIAG
jgi:hypothetical protein